MLHVDINKSHVNIIMLHVDIIYLACRWQKYATIVNLLKSATNKKKTIPNKIVSNLGYFTVVYLGHAIFFGNNYVVRTRYYLGRTTYLVRTTYHFSSLC